jgi:hypothetical protein
MWIGETKANPNHHSENTCKVVKEGRSVQSIRLLANNTLKDLFHSIPPNEKKGRNAFLLNEEVGIGNVKAVTEINPVH